MPLTALKGTKFPTEHTLADKLVILPVPVKILFAAIVYAGNAHRERIQREHIQESVRPARIGAETGFVVSFSHLIMIIEQGDDPIAKPDVGFFLNQNGIPE